MQLTIDKTFENQNFSDQKLPSREYDNCTFVNCDFSSTDMSVVTFLECRFDNCKFSSVMMKETSFQEVVFVECKMLGLDFSTCNDFMFSVEFGKCNLDLASFYGFVLKNTVFNNCNLKEADFTETDLTGSVFHNCNLSNAVFKNTIAERVDFRTAENFTIDPENNRLKKAKFSTSGLSGLLEKYDLIVK
ncbi:pentapeptide repeat-containing protein [Aquimarina sp. MMG016]|uniref:pentapeptide repeat-containing protein n=1 Tax=Aquimarina sp. MMG016 TaxID=2822690 RepID=UPI001B3A1A82|nr:pentapeptide repeat-containing protein [Aquimarina sp. MMG016]MBQ4819174.1 pentapeptide repeat-containing protein [Aquimarina sp. MMG016]